MHLLKLFCQPFIFKHSESNNMYFSANLCSSCLIVKPWSITSRFWASNCFSSLSNRSLTQQGLFFYLFLSVVTFYFYIYPIILHNTKICLTKKIMIVLGRSFSKCKPTVQIVDLIIFWKYINRFYPNKQKDFNYINQNCASTWLISFIISTNWLCIYF